MPAARCPLPALLAALYVRCPLLGTPWSAASLSVAVMASTASMVMDRAAAVMASTTGMLMDMVLDVGGGGDGKHDRHGDG